MILTERCGPRILVSVEDFMCALRGEMSSAADGDLEARALRLANKLFTAARAHGASRDEAAVLFANHYDNLVQNPAFLDAVEQLDRTQRRPPRQRPLKVEYKGPPIKALSQFSETWTDREIAAWRKSQAQ
jgi:hypothetical protein